MVLDALDGAALPVPTIAEGASAEVEHLEAELAELAELRGAGAISLAEWMAARQPLLDRIDAAKTIAGSARRAPANMHLLSEPGAVRRAWPSLGLNDRREVITAAIERVVVGPASRGRWTKIAERVTVTWRV